MRKHSEFTEKLHEQSLAKELKQIENKDNEIDWKRAYSEVHQLLQHCGSFINTIPKSFTMFLYENMDKSWGGNLDFTKELDSMELLKETRILLSLIYRDFVCTDEERQVLVEAERLESEKAGIEYDDQSLRDLFAD